MAAQSLVRPSYEDPVGTYATNVMGTLHLLEAVRRTPSVKTAVIVTSDKCYENREQNSPFVEEDAMGGSAPYSISNGWAELVTASYRRSFFSEGATSIASVRAGYVIGGGDWALDRLVPDIMTARLQNKPLIFRNPGLIRPWQHVLDPLSGYPSLAEAFGSSRSAELDAYNFAPPEESCIRVKDLVCKIDRTLGLPQSKWDATSAPQVHEAGLLKLDRGKARRVLGWKPRLDIDSAIEWTVKWYKAFQTKPSACAEFTNQQIARYVELR